MTHNSNYQEDRVNVDPIAVSKVIPIKKVGLTTTLSFDVIWDYHWAEKFPRLHHTVTHPVTKAQQRAYDEFAKRWCEMDALRAKLIAEGEKKGWATDEGGYDWEPARLTPPQPRVEFIYEETEEEWRARVTPIIQHHHETGEWLVEPQPTLMERLTFGFTRTV